MVNAFPPRVFDGETSGLSPYDGETTLVPRFFWKFLDAVMRSVRLCPVHNPSFAFVDRITSDQQLPIGVT
jgi:hypothetical protein